MSKKPVYEVKLHGQLVSTKYSTAQQIPVNADLVGISLVELASGTVGGYSESLRDLPEWITKVKFTDSPIAEIAPGDMASIFASLPPHVTELTCPADYFFNQYKGNVYTLFDSLPATVKSVRISPFLFDWNKEPEEIFKKISPPKD